MIKTDTLAPQQEHRKCPKGSLALGYLAQLASFGAPTRNLVPYRPNCNYLDSIPSQPAFPNSYPGMRRFRIGSYATFRIDTGPAKAVKLIKEYFACGQAVAFSGSVLCGYGKNPKFKDGAIYETATKPDPGHGQVVIGYDDNIGTPGKTGALLIQNSFGTAWPPASAGSAAPPGKAYWSYHSFTSTQKLAAIAYPRSPGIVGAKLLRSNNPRAPSASVMRFFQWAPGDMQGVYLILTLSFDNPVFLSTVWLTEPGTSHLTAEARYGQFISTGYSYLKRTDSHAFLSGTYLVTLYGEDIVGNPVTYTGPVIAGAPKPHTPPEKSMADAKITGSTGAAATLLIEGLTESAGANRRRD